MAADLNLNDVLAVKVACFSNGQLGLNVHHYEVQARTGFGTTDLFAAVYFDNLFAPLYKALLGNNASYYGVNVQVVSRVAKLASVTSAFNTGVGSGVTECLPGQVCGVISKTTALAGRARRGRAYVPFPARQFNDLVLDLPTAGYKLLLDALADAMDNAHVIGGVGSSDTLFPVLFRPATGVRQTIRQCVARRAWGTQRRRGNYGSPNAFPPF